MSKTILAAGGSGKLGREVVRRLLAQGWTVRVLTRNAAKVKAMFGDRVIAVEGDALRGDTLGVALAGCDAVFSCLGAAVTSDWKAGRPGFFSVDIPANRNLIMAAKQFGVKRFVYVSMLAPAGFPSTWYTDAHLKVEEILRESGLRHVVVRPTGFFSGFAEIYDMAAKNRAVMFGGGEARTNPVDDGDLAEVCVEVIESGEGGLVEAGGPDILTRRRILEMAFEARNKPVKYTRIPVWLGKLAGSLLRLFHPRMGELVHFIACLHQHDLVAPRRGKQRLADFLADVHRRRAGN
ncbi:MAG: NAD(P)H azoreductase [Myxococcota bacterium]|nr:NAD(P)H azoreductase [Myxococcota bacterium]